MKRILDTIIQPMTVAIGDAALRCSATGYEGYQMKWLALLQMTAAEQISRTMNEDEQARCGG